MRSPQGGPTMTMLVNVLAAVLCVFCIEQVRAQRSNKWNLCHCKWAPWHSWTACTRECWGVQMRKRQVWKKNTPVCTGYQVCDKGNGALHLQRCNKKCTNGHYNKKLHKCVCPPGLYGVCCRQVVQCGKPPAILNSKVNDVNYNYSDVVKYECLKGYHLKGSSEITCGDTGWNGTLPQCVALDPCDGVTCPVGEKCKAKGNSYTCYCPKNAPCNLDLAPEIVSCPESKNITTPDRRILYKWNPPKFKDPGGEKLVIESNYPDNKFRFPWQKSIIQYTATKKSNGQRAVCKFSVDVRPIPCKGLSAPSKGFLVCTKWRSAYGKFCLFGCTEDYEMPDTFDPRQWVVCGSSGVWTPSNLPKECHVMFGGGGDDIKENALQKVDECLHGASQLGLKSQFLHLLKKSPFKSFCTEHQEQCTKDNVEVKCWNSGLIGEDDSSIF